MSTTPPTEGPAPSPDAFRTPTSFEGLHVSEGVLIDTVVRRILSEGRTSVLALSSQVGLSISLTQVLVEELRDQKLIEFTGMAGRDQMMSLTDAGRVTATERMARCRYAGVLPVSLEHYSTTVVGQRSSVRIDRQGLSRAMGDLVLDPALIDQFGPALIADGAIFLYGPPGTGKTSLAERMMRVFTSPVLIPHAVEVDGQIITVFDPIVHEPLEHQPPGLDPRWVLCRRPSIIVGGELTAGMLELSFDERVGIYTAPLQMKANNGVLIIDDFGRQTMTPDELLNRWIVPLSRNIDFLALAYGYKFEVPFQSRIVLSTNLDPDKLGDDAFFRRIQSKIFVGPITDEQFNEILRRVVNAYEARIDADAVAYLAHVCRTKGDGELRPYVPVELCKTLKAVATYENRPLVIDRAAIDRFASVYFTRNSQTSTPTPAPMAPVTPAPGSPAGGPQPGSPAAGSPAPASQAVPGPPPTAANRPLPPALVASRPDQP